MAGGTAGKPSVADRAITGFVEELATAVVNNRFFYLDHPRVKGSIEKMLTHVEALLGASESGVVEIGFMNEYVVFQGEPLLGASRSAMRLIEAVKARSARSMELSYGLGRSDLCSLVEVLSRVPEPGATFNDLSRAMSTAGVETIRFLGAYKAHGDGSLAVPTTGALHVYQRLVELAGDLMLQAAGDKKLRPFGDQLRNRLTAALEMLTENPVELFEMCGYETFDAMGVSHMVRVSLLTLHCLRHLDCSREVTLRIGAAAFLHDLGMSRLPRALLEKSGVLTRSERDAMELHPLHGLEILAESGEVDELALSVALGHHRYPDGEGGYPLFPTAVPVSPAARLVKVIDAYEALTAPRPYREQMETPKAYRAMLGMTGQFDPLLLRAFIAANGFYPLGTRLHLASGETVKVVAMGPAPHLPQVRLLTNRAGEELDPAEATDLATVDAPGAGLALADPT